MFFGALSDITVVRNYKERRGGMNTNAISGFTSIEQVTNQYLKTNKTKSSDLAAAGSFASFLQKTVDEQEGVKFSKHAAKRLDDRDITISEDQKNRLNFGVQLADEKGIKDSLVMVDSLAFIVNVPSQTVITAMGKDESDDGVFTNIDGAVIA